MLYQIRLATPNDALAIQTFYEESLPHINSEQTSWIPGVYPSIKDALLAVSEDEFFICLDEKNSVVGSMILNNKSDDEYQKLTWLNSEKDVPHLVVHTLISHPKRLKQGIASQMVSFIKQFATENNLFSIRLDTLVDNIPARKLYEKNDFSYIGRHSLTSFDGRGVDDCVFYEFKIEG